MRRLALVALPLLLGINAVSCTTTATSGAAGELELGEGSWALADVDCARVGSSRAVAALVLPPDAMPLVVDADVADGSATATVRRIDDQESWVGSGLTTDLDGTSDQIELTGSLVAYEGPDRRGEEDLRLRLDCPTDADPGGGYLAIGGTEVSYDQVTCVELDGRFEARGTSRHDDGQVVTVTRSTGRSGTEDRLEVAGAVARRVTGPEMFEIRGPRVSLAGPTLPEGEPASLDLTCGLRVQQPRD